MKCIDKTFHKVHPTLCFNYIVHKRPKHLHCYLDILVVYF